MRDQYQLAQECLAVEERHESVMDYLRGRGFISPRATWERLQLNELHREPKRLTKGTCDMYKGKMTTEQWQQAVEMAINGQEPFEFLQECGYKNPVSAWAAYRAQLKQRDPELLEKIPSFRKSGRQRNAEKQKAEKKAMTIAEVFAEVEEPAEPKITRPVNYDGFDVCGIRGELGEYSYSDNGDGWIDFNGISGDDISMPIPQWKKFIAELRRAALIMGVEL